MANGFGPATFGLQQAIQALLRGQGASPLAPVPLTPTGGIGSLNFETTAALAALQPQPVPPALPTPVDTEAIRARFAGLAGPEPVAPVTQPNPLILRIARALQGFGAGVQGQGPQFLAALREERERPQREFQAKKERFETRRQELGLLSEQAVLSAEEKRAARTQELLDKQSEREFEQGVTRLKLKSQREQDLFRDALLARRQREEDERQAEENRRKEEAQKIRDARIFAREYRKAGAGKFAKELADFDAGITTELSAAAEKWESAQVRLAQIRADRAARGGAGAKPPLTAVLENGSTVPASLVDKELGSVRIGGQSVKVVNYVGGGVTAAPPAPALPGLSPSGIPLAPGTLGAPAPFAAPQQPAQAGTVFTRAQVNANAKKNKRDPKDVEADIRAAGGIVQ